MKLTNEEIEEGLKRCDEATPGPWRKRLFTSEEENIDGEMIPWLFAQGPVHNGLLDGALDQAIGDAMFLDFAGPDRVKALLIELKKSREELQEAKSLYVKLEEDTRTEFVRLGVLLKILSPYLKLNNEEAAEVGKAIIGFFKKD